MLDRIITGATVVLDSGATHVDVGIADGRIAGLYAAGAAPDAADRLKAEGLVLMPGAIDAHTHFTASPDGVEDEIFAGTQGAAAGGVTTVIEMPHSLPPAIDLAGFAAKHALCAANAAVDFALWAGLDGVNAGQLRALHKAGAIGFKGFLCSPRADGAAPDPTALPAIGDRALLEAMRVAAEIGALVGIHSENHDILLAAQARLRAEGRMDMRAHAEAGPELAEIEAVQRLILFAEMTGAKTHVVHMASARAADLLNAARGRADLTAETCLHYLCLDEEDLVRIGPVARCGPPLRPRAVADALWDRVMAGAIDMIASDHCPYDPALKHNNLPVWEAGMGLTGIETNVPLLMSEGVIARGLPLHAFARMTATAPAQRFGLKQKGAIRIGLDADMTLWDLNGSTTVRGDAFHGRAKFSAFEGTVMRGQLRRTILRGEDVFADGHDLGRRGQGRFQRA
ncbi:allantoinase AllB [Falsirhodobacter halotolerans]|uniref:allantoinase AllB n=1 Tax=Falsirhodobacter halotolerans TaxID=1146892 RepID=UPI001FCFE300|nr:allantoinase AllB [Falsirhodobacter halotolerans]MCJ8139095.1 allantoinase AllB [Falsirhodobacter halotolerans]